MLNFPLVYPKKYIVDQSFAVDTDTREKMNLSPQSSIDHHIVKQLMLKLLQILYCFI